MIYMDSYFNVAVVLFNLLFPLYIMSVRRIKSSRLLKITLAARSPRSID